MVCFFLKMFLYFPPGGNLFLIKKQVALITFGIHMVTSFVGRFYEGDFDQNHDFEHWPGMVMLFLYGVGGLFFVLRLTTMMKMMEIEAQVCKRERERERESDYCSE